jgi:hypothetical protein
MSLRKGKSWAFVWLAVVVLGLVFDSPHASSSCQNQVARTKERVLPKWLLKQPTLRETVQSKTDAGYVLEIEGKWFLDRYPREYLAMGQTLRAGEKIRIQSPTANDHITIAGPSGEIIIRRNCSNAGECNRRVIIPSPEDARSNIFGAILHTAMELIYGKPERYSVHGVRGINNDLEEAVCLVEKGKVDLSRAFRRMPKGVYYLKIRSLQPSATRKTYGPLQFDWDQGASSVLDVSGLTPGIYEIRLLVRSDGEYEPTSLTVWILFLNKLDFARASDSFGQAIELTGGWGKPLTDETKRSVLRACLDNLATRSLR